MCETFQQSKHAPRGGQNVRAEIRSDEKTIDMSALASDRQ
jgi:hypothetical protein